MALGQFSRRRIMLFFYFTTRVGQKVPRQNKSIFMTVKTKASSKNISVTIIPSDEEADKTLNQTFLFSTTLEMSILHQQQNENGTVHAHTRTLCSFFFFFFVPQTHMCLSESRKCHFLKMPKYICRPRSYLGISFGLQMEICPLISCYVKQAACVCLCETKMRSRLLPSAYES